MPEEYIKPGFIPNLPPFKAWLASNIPAVYDNTMSYYDELTGLIAYIEKEVMPAVNGNSAAIEQLQNLFTELKSYVDNYFDNLDVQEEINNKLDAMAESGQLTDIIAQYLGLAGLITFDTVADMKLAENLVNGSKCRTLGYRSVNDGGTALYKIRNITNSDTVNEMTIIALNDPSLVAELVVENRVNVKQVGAYGDGTHDDATTINALIDLVSLDDTIYFPDGDYLINSTITIDRLVNIECDGNIKSNGCYPAILVDNIKGNKLHINRIVESDAQTVAFNESTNNNAGVILKNTLYTDLKAEEIKGFVTGLIIIGDQTGASGGAYYNTISILHLDSCFHGVILFGGASGSVNGNTFNDIVYDFHTWTGEEDTPYFIQIKNTTGNTYYNNANNFYKLRAEYGISGEGGPKLLNIQNGQNNFFEFDRIEIASDSYQEPFVFATTNARCNQVEVKFMTKSFEFEITADRNIVHCPVQYGNLNHQNNIKNITSDLTFPEGVSVIEGSAFVDKVNRLVYVNLTLQCATSVPSGSTLIGGLPHPIENTFFYIDYSTTNSLYSNPTKKSCIYMSRSADTLVNRTNIDAGTNGWTTAINIVYRLSQW